VCELVYVRVDAGLAMVEIRVLSAPILPSKGLGESRASPRTPV